MNSATWAPETVVIKYLEVNHTFMAADAVHGAIGRRLKKQTLPTFRSFSTLCASSSKTFEVVEMGVGEFYQINKEKRPVSKKNAGEYIKLTTIVQVTFTKGKSSIIIKTSFKGESTEHDILKKRFVDSGLWLTMPETIQTRRGIPTNKKNGIIGALTDDISEDDKCWWDTLTVNDSSVDLGITREKGEIITG